MNSATVATEASPGQEFEVFKQLVGYISGTVGSVKAYLKKLLNISIVLGLCLTASAYGWLEQMGISLAVAAVFSFLPVLLLLVLRSRLSDIEALPEELNGLENVAGQISAQIREHNMSDKFQSLLSSSDQSFRQRMKKIIGIAPMILELRGYLEGIVKPHVLGTLLAAANPAFGFALAFAILPVLLWGFFLLVSTLLLLIF
ncbi:MAG: hypothetical protein ACR2QG_04420 [Gammaproteobacteria bacterium]